MWGGAGGWRAVHGHSLPACVRRVGAGGHGWQQGVPAGGLASSFTATISVLLMPQPVCLKDLMEVSTCSSLQGAVVRKLLTCTCVCVVLPQAGERITLPLKIQSLSPPAGYGSDSSVAAVSRAPGGAAAAGKRPPLNAKKVGVGHGC